MFSLQILNVLHSMNWMMCVQSRKVFPPVCYSGCRDSFAIRHQSRPRTQLFARAASVLRSGCSLARYRYGYAIDVIRVIQTLVADDNQED